LVDELYFQRAVQTYLWALPALNTYGMKGPRLGNALMNRYCLAVATGAAETQGA
jgi:hypothetical protein